MVGWGKWAPGELALWFIIITRSVHIPSNYLSYIYLLHKLLVHFFILFFYSTTGLVAGLWDVLWDFLPLILIFLLKFGLKLQYVHFTHIILLLLTGIMKIIFIFLLLPLLMNPTVILDSCTRYAYPNTKILCTACREGYYLKYGVCFSC